MPEDKEGLLLTDKEIADILGLGCEDKCVSFGDPHEEVLVDFSELLKAQLQKILDAGYKSPEEQSKSADLLYLSTQKLYEAKIEEAKKQERERVARWAEEPCPHQSTVDMDSASVVIENYLPLHKRDCEQCWEILLSKSPDKGE